MKNKLSFFEDFSYFILWTLACFYSMYKLYESQTEVLSNPYARYSIYDLKPGWTILRRLKDDSDFEWNTWKHFIHMARFYMVFHCCLSEITRRINVSMLKYWYILSTGIFMAKFMDVNHIIAVIIQPIIFCTILKLGATRTSIWVTGVFLLSIYNTLKYRQYIWNFLECKDDEETLLIFYAVPWILLRCINYSLDYVEKAEKPKVCPDNSEGTQDKLKELSMFEHVINLFSYSLYLPVLFVGPVISYENFEKSFNVNCNNLSSRIKTFMVNIVLYSIYTILLDVALHFLYFNAMRNDLKAIQKMSSIALCGGGVWMGLEFLTKYVVIYGTCSAYAKLDNIDAPPTPRCIARICLYSQMWRYFDVGLYKFLFRFIYIPALNTLQDMKVMSKTNCKLLSSLCTFIFIFIWHGVTWSILVWSTLNYIGILIEHTAKRLAYSEQYLWFKDNILRTEAMEIRFTAFICAPLLGLSAVSNFYLFAGYQVAELYFGLFPPSLFNFVFLYFSLYCCCHVGIALKNVPSRTDVTKPDSEKKCCCFQSKVN